MIDPETAQALQDAMAGYLQDGDLVVGWLLTLEIASADGGHYLAHRHGGGHDGRNPPTDWALIGMSQAASDHLRDELRKGSFNDDDD